MRYAGQGYEIAVACRAEPLRAADLNELRITFDHQHGSMFGHMAPEEPVEIVSYRMRGVGLVPAVALPKFARTGAALADARRGIPPPPLHGPHLPPPAPPPPPPPPPPP